MAGAAAVRGVPRWRGPAGGAGPRPGRPAGSGARDGGEPAAVAAVLNGERDGEDEESVGKLTGRSNRAEDGRRGKIDERGRSSGER